MKNYVAGYRKMFGITQKELAEKIGVMPATLCNKETGKRLFSQAEMISILEIFKEFDRSVTLDKIFYP